MTVFLFWHPDEAILEIDLFLQEPFDFEVFYARSVIVDLDNTQARVIGLVDLISLKKQVGRHQDIADIEAQQTPLVTLHTQL